MSYSEENLLVVCVVSVTLGDTKKWRALQDSEARGIGNVHLFLVAWNPLPCSKPNLVPRSLDNPRGSDLPPAPPPPPHCCPNKVFLLRASSETILVGFYFFSPSSVHSCAAFQIS